MSNLIDKAKQILSFAIASLSFTASFIGYTCLIFGSNTIRVIALLILIYQYTLATRWEKLITWSISLRGDKYFKKFEVIFEEPILAQKQQKILLAGFPHGATSVGKWLSYIDYYDVFKTFHSLGSRAMLYIPFSGIFSRWYGLEGVNNENFKKLMKNNENISFIVGGFEEATAYEYGRDIIFLKQRKGWIKYALQYGYKIVPSYTFNENKTYKAFKFGKLGQLLNKFKMPGMIPYTKYFFIFPDPNIELYYVVGKGIQFPKIDNPTPQDVDKYHQIFTEALQDLYDRYASKFNLKTKLEII